MMTYNFKPQFVPLIVADKKLSTIRAYRKDGKIPTTGETLRLYTGMRTKKCRQIGERICERVSTFSIWPTGTYRVSVDGKWLTEDQLRRLSKRDGFKSFDKLVEFFGEVHKLPFFGILIEWMPRKALRPDQFKLL